MINTNSRLSLAIGIAMLAGTSVLAGCVVSPGPETRVTTTEQTTTTMPRPVMSTTTTTTQQNRP